MKEKAKILVVEDDNVALYDINAILAEEDYKVDLASNYSDAIKLLKSNYYNVLVTDLKLPENSGLEVFSFAKKNNSIYGGILITGYSDEASIIQAANLGVKEILKKPFSDEKLLSAVGKILELQAKEESEKLYAEKLQKENVILKEELNKKLKDTLQIIGESPKLISALKKAEQIAKYQLNCIIGGESGTGKELLAQYIHMHGPRKEKPFVEVNCASLSPTLFEAEFFGYKKGAFTNANETRAGYFEIADGGVLFLDEITEIPLEMQAKLLTAVERGVIHKVGDTNEIKINVQIIAATNHDIDKIVSENRLRRDLYHRLTQGLIILPPLRERGKDIEILLDYYIKKYEDEFSKKAKEIDEELWEKIINYSWPGNIRQFTNFVKKWVLFGENEIDCDVETLFEEIPKKKPLDVMLSFDFINGTMEELEKAKKMLIEKVLVKYDGNKSKTARHLGITYQGLLKMIKKLNIG